MSMISDRVSYLKGLADGMKVDDSTNEGKLLISILDVLEDIAFELEDDRNAIEELEDQAESLDNDLGELENFVYDADCDCDCDCGCDDCDCDDKANVGYISIECPHCKKETSFDIGLFDKDTKYVECPNCHHKIDVVYEDEADCCCHSDDE